MIATYKRQAKRFSADGDDDSGWNDEEDEELARGEPVSEPFGPESVLSDAGVTPWFQMDARSGAPMQPGQDASFAQVDPGDEPVAKGVSSRGAPITDAVASGDTTPNAAPDVEANASGGQPVSTWERYREAVAQTPTMGHAPWYMNLLGRAAGAAAGWTNAASRIRNPIDVAAVREGAMHPGFAQRQEEFESNMSPIRAELAAEMGQREQQLKAQDIASQAAQRAGQANMYNQRAYFYHASADGRFVVDDKNHLIVNQRTGEAMPLPNDQVATYEAILKATGDQALAKYEAFDKYKAPVPKALNPLQEAQSILLHPEQHTPQEVANATAVTRKQFAPPRVSTGGVRQPGGAQFGSAESQRLTLQTRAKDKFDRAMTAAGVNAALRQQAQTNYNRDLAIIDRGYNDRVSALRNPNGVGGTPTPPPNRPPLSQIFGR